jgi:hypothetical protein
MLIRKNSTMNYDFVLRDCDPRLGQQLAVLADLLSLDTATPEGFPEGTFLEEEYLEVLQQLMNCTLQKFLVEAGLMLIPGQSDDPAIILYQQVQAVRDTLEAQRSGTAGSEQRRQWEAGTVTIGLLSDFVRWPDRTSPYPLAAQLKAVSVLVDQALKYFSVSASRCPCLEPVLQQGRAWQEGIEALLLDCGELYADIEDSDAEFLHAPTSPAGVPA